MSFYPSRPRPTFMGSLPAGPAGIAQTLKIMTRLAREYRKDPGVREVAAQLVRGLPQYDTAGEVKALHAFVRDAIRYTNDTRGVETVQTPRVTLETGIGDCDDKALLLATLLESIGRPARFVAIGMNDGPLSHVLTEVRHGPRGRWIPLETIRPVDIGWYPPGVTAKMVAHI